MRFIFYLLGSLLGIDLGEIFEDTAVEAPPESQALAMGGATEVGLPTVTEMTEADGGASAIGAFDGGISPDRFDPGPVAGPWTP